MEAHPVIPIDITVDRQSVKDALRALLHAILFHRLFGSIKPFYFDVLDVTIPGIEDSEVDRLIDNRVGALYRAMDGYTNKRGQLVVILSEKRAKKTWFGSGEEEYTWEQWVINVEIRQPKNDDERQTLHRAVSDTLARAVRTILDHTSSEKGRAAVPPIRQNEGLSPFPYRIVAKIGGLELQSS
ncbi:DUF1649-domain-containing protein [Auricularia subglabra TFB-10046 SS5]|uniref:Autophagy-related protein 101 n=1 Tax=Auricularia subglabra (strain TFB-10046 / SS5) TaxID=717982 RepID=J0LHQ4_AURST|nr:DUF1649-domain-containing protein [Auricularia subglabra TFB-10046 SS5]